MTKTIFTRFLTLALSLGLVAGCGGNTGSSGSSSTGFTPALDTDTAQIITVLGNYDNFEALDAAALSFQEYYPNIEIKYEKLDEYNTNIGPRVTDDTDAALFMINRYNFIEAPELADVITDISTLDIDFDGINEQAYKACYYDGKLYGIPLWFRLYGIVVNEDMFKDLGVDVPVTLDGLYEACDAILKDDTTPLQQSADGVVTFYLPKLMNIVAKNMSDDEVASLLKGESGSADKLKDVYDMIFEHIDKKYISLDNMLTYNDNYDAAILKFFEGKTPILVATTSTVSGMEKRETRSDAFKENPFTYSFHYTPTGEKEPQVYKAVDTGFALNKNCAYYDVAAEFYRFIYTEDILNQFAEVKGLPSVAANPTSELYENLPDVAEDSLVLEGDFEDPTARIQDVFTEVTLDIFSGKITNTDDALSHFEEHCKAQADES